MFTEHPAQHYDVFNDGHQGMHDGVLLIPGAEMNGFLVFPKQSPRDLAAADKQEFRLEAWLALAGKEQIWILANPIYVRN